MKRFKADLHVHTALSPCASEEMLPARIVEEALAKGIAMIAICDHNSAANVGAVVEAASGDLAVIAGLEMTTREEVHVVGLFATAEIAERAGESVLRTLPNNTSRADRLGRQLLVDALGRVVGEETRMLSAATSLSLEEAVALIRRHGGLAVAAHADRPHYGLLGQLGFFPETTVFDAAELGPSGGALPWNGPTIVSSDAHFPVDVGARCSFVTAEEAGFDELALAIKGIGGRAVEVA